MQAQRLWLQRQSLLLFRPQFHPGMNVTNKDLTFIRVPGGETSLARRHSVRADKTARGRLTLLFSQAERSLVFYQRKTTRDFP